MPRLRIFSLLICSVLVQHVANLGYHWRQRMIGIRPADSTTPYHQPDPEPLLILVPSCREEPDVVRRALWSAGLIEYPGRRVLLLIDDPPRPANAADAVLLEAARQLPNTLGEAFAAPAARMNAALAEYRTRARGGALQAEAEAKRLAALYEWAAAWLDAEADAYVHDRSHAITHTDRLFVQRILNEPAQAWRAHADDLLAGKIGAAEFGLEYHRLAALFRVEFGSFERKRYANLSHAPNKAMNLNSYIALIGGSFREVPRGDGCWLERCDPEAANLSVPSSRYIVTVDADSLITADYALRLVEVLERPGNERVGIAQTPYTAIPGTPISLEHAAAASTDAMFFDHQGMAQYDASFWVGASALMRRAALEDIATEREERGHRIKVFIEDRVLIEDAAGTIDLLKRGWRVYHHPGRLSYSATPADFGALLIQRRRWANGGLLILPNLLGYVFRRPWSLRRFGKGLLRAPNLTSSATSGIGLPILLLFPFDERLVPPWMALAGIPYFLLLGLNLSLAGYKWADLPRVYALNVLLIPVNLAGTLQSLYQAINGRSIPFKRTPKLPERTPIPAIYVTLIFGLCMYALVCLRHGHPRRPLHAQRLYAAQRHRRDLWDHRLHRFCREPGRYAGAASPAPAVYRRPSANQAIAARRPRFGVAAALNGTRVW
jgi:cellulose synthase/poly-beta-1,6-N-acetylglucosamine synthase-like glycosyltransferase